MLRCSLERTIGVSFRRRYYRDSCTVKNGYYLKDLTKVCVCVRVCVCACV